MTKLSAERLAHLRTGGSWHSGPDRSDMQDALDTIAALEAERDALARVADAAELFAKEGTTLTQCDRGFCQRVIEKKDKSDPQCKLFDALRAAGRLP